MNIRSGDGFRCHNCGNYIQFRLSDFVLNRLEDNKWLVPNLVSGNGVDRCGIKSAVRLIARRHYRPVIFLECASSFYAMRLNRFQILHLTEPVRLELAIRSSCLSPFKSRGSGVGQRRFGVDGVRDKCLFEPAIALH
jgi:hypothetical protein